MDFSGRHYPKDLILQAVRWYLRYNLSYRDMEEILEERGVEIDHTLPTAGCKNTLPSWRPNTVSVARFAVLPGGWMRPTSRSRVNWSISTEPWIRKGIPWTSCSPKSGIRRPPPGFLRKPYVLMVHRRRSPSTRAELNRCTQ